VALVAQEKTMVMILTSSVDRLNTFLKTASSHTDAGLRGHIVMGNESADLDSVVSSLVYAYYLHHRSTDENKCILPLINMPSAHFRLKPEIAFWLDEAGVDIRHLIFSDGVDLNDWDAKGQLRVTLVDHNVLSPSQSYLQDAVFEVIDHHYAEDQPFPRLERLVIEPVGSTATLVAECILDTMPELIDDTLAKFLLGPILLDTVNLDRSKGRCQDKDILIALRLLTISPLPRDEVFVELMTKKSDVSGLQAEELFIRDVKTWTVSDFRFAISVIPIKLKPWLEENPELPAKIEWYRLNMDLDLYLLMAYSHAPRFNREIIGHAADELFLTRLFTSFLEPLLGLAPLNDMPLALEGGHRFLAYTQNNALMSRKKLVPLLKRYLEEL
jgi:exopolyphosphatase